MGWGAGGDRQVSGAWDRADVREILMFMEGGIRRAELAEPGAGVEEGDGEQTAVWERAEAGCCGLPGERVLHRGSMAAGREWVPSACWT